MSAPPVNAAAASGSAGGSASAGASAAAPALALVETASIARGHVVADAMVKKAPVSLLECRATTPGKFLVLVAGPVADVDEAFRIGVTVGADTVIDRLFLPQAHESLAAAIRGEARKGGAGVEAVAVVELASVASTLLAADAACKGARVRVIEMQLARGIGGKGFFTLSGPLAEIEAAVEAATGVVAREAVVATEIIARPHEDFVARLR